MSAGYKQSDDFVEGEKGFSLEAEVEEEVVEEAPVEKAEAPKMGPVYTRGPGGQLVIVEESDEN